MRFAVFSLMAAVLVITHPEKGAADTPVCPNLSSDVMYSISNGSVTGKSLSVVERPGGGNTIDLQPTNKTDTRQRWKVELIKACVYRLSNEFLGDGLALTADIKMAAADNYWQMTSTGTNTYQLSLFQSGVLDGQVLTYATWHTGPVYVRPNQKNAAQNWTFEQLKALPTAATTAGLLLTRYDCGGDRPVDPLAEQKRIRIGANEVVKFSIWLPKKPAKPVHITYEISCDDGSCTGAYRNSGTDYGLLEPGSVMDGPDMNQTTKAHERWFTVPFGSSQLGLAPEQIFIRVRGNPYFKQDKTRDFRIRFQLSSEDKTYDKQKVASVLFRLYAGPKDPDVYPPKPETEPSSYSRKSYAPASSADGSAAMARCEKENGKGNCSYGTSSWVYVKCKPGYKAKGSKCIK